VEINKTKWRIEITKKGRYWQWRKGSRDERISAYGGKFGNLNPIRQHEYQENIKSYSRTKPGNSSAGAMEL